MTSNGNNNDIIWKIGNNSTLRIMLAVFCTVATIALFIALSEAYTGGEALIFGIFTTIMGVGAIINFITAFRIEAARNRREEQKFAIELAYAQQAALEDPFAINNLARKYNTTE